MGGLHCEKHNINTFRPVFLTDRLSLRPFYRRANCHIAVFKFICVQWCPTFFPIMCLISLLYRIRGIMVSVLASSVVDLGSRPVRVKPRTISLLSVASPLST